MIGEALRLIRVLHDCKVSELSKAIGISPSYISEIENNKKTPSMDIIEKYAGFFETKVSNIMFFSESIEGENFGVAKSKSRQILMKFLQIIENATR